MQASPTKVIDYFNGQKQNLIPLFQRPYTWKESNWQTLWDDVLVQCDIGDDGTHFMGAIVSVPAVANPVGINKHLIIDGQQRLTTISLLLCALRDSLDTNSASRIQEVYLTNRYCEVEDTLKFVPTQADRAIYGQLVIDREVPDSDCMMVKAYHFFKKQLSKGSDLNGDPVEPSKVLTAIEHSLQVVMINLGSDDDPYLIFESLNFKGEPLTQADLVRNYLLMRFRHSITAGGEQERVYKKYWQHLEGTLGNNLTEFLRHYVMKDGEDTKRGGIYAAIKANLKSMSKTEDVEAEIKSMQRFGQFYSVILCLDKDSDQVVYDRITNIQELKVTTSYPLLLRLFDARDTHSIDNVGLEKCLGFIESFIVRRSVCGVPTNALNKLFIQWAKNFPEAHHVEWLRNSLISGSASRRLPKDAEFSGAFLDQPQYGRGTTRFVLCRLEKSFEHKEVVDLSGATIEHVLPQKLSQKWKDDLGLEAEEVHSTLLNAFGNLTLTGYNAELGNLPFFDKKAKLQNTHIELNRWILEQNKWGAEEIQARAKQMLAKAIEIWPEP
jgi:uncharacterized protein with ParB-like and HNH nuclease domain